MAENLTRNINFIQKTPLRCNFWHVSKHLLKDTKRRFYTTEIVQVSVSLVTTCMIILHFNLTKSANHIKSIMEKITENQSHYLSTYLKVYIIHRSLCVRIWLKEKNPNWKPVRIRTSDQTVSVPMDTSTTALKAEWSEQRRQEAWKSHKNKKSAGSFVSYIYQSSYTQEVSPTWQPKRSEQGWHCRQAHSSSTRDKEQQTTTEWWEGEGVSPRGNPPDSYSLSSSRSEIL